MDVEHYPVSADSPSLPYNINSLWFWSLCHPLRAINKSRDILVSPSFLKMEHDLLPFSPLYDSAINRLLPQLVAI
ncbi:hypothetical protein T07_6102 [Trichinella nelsoni]|uniref:Uncharacterized protein n=1 Tax=Trichinella nelsoni TaxID=6336 RepID=A0A0V0RTB4_9BILA|nr:hypothetical protein T07_6102 [Trichinella nelsoni]